MKQVKLCDLREVRHYLNKSEICYEDIIRCVAEYGKSSCIIGGLSDEDGWILDCKVGEWSDSYDWYMNFGDNTIRFDMDETLPNVEYLIIDIYDNWIDFSENIIE